MLLARGELVRALRCLSAAESNERLVDAVRRFALPLGSLETGEFPHHLHAILRSAVDEGDGEMAALALWRIAWSTVAMITSHRAEQRRGVRALCAEVSPRSG